MLSLQPPSPPASAAYEDALRRLLSLADFERMAGLAASPPKSGLERMRELADRMGLPDGGAPIIHVAGTKGKGSVAAMTESALRAQGLRTGLYTSPHLHSFRERIRIDGEPLSGEAFAAAVDRVWPSVEAMARSDRGAPSTFEALTAMALDVFRQESVEAVALEVGLGGRLDATNVAESSVAVITSISLDHTAILGSTLAEIAGEKAGVIKGRGPVVSAPQAPEAAGVIAARAAAMGAPLTMVGRGVSYEREAGGLCGQRVTVTTERGAYGLRLPLLGAHQAENAAVAIAALEASPLSVSRSAAEAGLASARWDGRFQLLRESPYLVVDGAHNPYSMARLGETVREHLPGARTVLVFGASADKRIDALVDEAAAFADEAWTAASRHPRAADPDALAALFAERGTPARSAGSVAEALERALDAAGEGGLALATGSLFVVAEALQSHFGIAAEHYPEFDPQAFALGRVG